jgi:hypothetical protein
MYRIILWSNQFTLVSATSSFVLSRISSAICLGGGIIWWLTNSKYMLHHLYNPDSPSEVTLRSVDEVRSYLLSPGTCKCGINCPINIADIFNFQPEVSVHSCCYVIYKCSRTYAKYIRTVMFVGREINFLDRFCSYVRTRAITPVSCFCSIDCGLLSRHRCSEHE